MPFTLDPIDIKILDLMQRDASLSTAELAERVGLSQSPCWRRIQRLREEGYIKAVVAIVDHKKLGFTMQIFAQVKMTTLSEEERENFYKAINKPQGIVILTGPTGSGKSTTLAALLDTLDPDAPQVERHLWLVRLLDWMRGDRSSVATTLERLQLLIERLEGDTELRMRAQAWWLALLDGVRTGNPDLYARISEVRWDEGGGLRVFLPGVIVRAPSDCGVARFEEILPVEQDVTRRGLRAVEFDLRFRDQVVARIQ